MVLVLGLLAVALVVALVLWATIGRGGDEGGATATTPVGGAAPARRRRPPAVRRRSPPSSPTTPTATARRTTSWPRPPLADGDPTTNWRTVCYARSLMGGKEGVGLVVSLSAPATGTLSFDVVNAPYQIDVFASDAAAVPAGFADWGPALGPKQFADDPAPSVVPVADAGPPPADRAPRARPGPRLHGGQPVPRGDR